MSRVEFEKIPQTNNNIRSLGSLVFDKRNELGDRAHLDLTNISSHQALARDFIAALYQHTSPSRIASDLTIWTYVQTIKEFLEYVDQKKLPEQFRMMEITYEFLLEYRAHIQLTSSSFKSSHPRRHFGNLIRLLAAAQAIDLARSDFLPPRNFAYKSDSDRIQPYTAGEALDLEHVCRIDIRALLTRLDTGRQLLTTGTDPRGHNNRRDPQTGRMLRLAPSERPWLQLPNILWYIVNVIDGQYLNNPELLAGRHSTLINVLSGSAYIPYGKKDVYSLLYPLTTDLIPFINLLAKKTGRNESSILTLTRDCLQEVDGRFILWYEKNRGGARKYKKIIDNEGQFSPVALIKTLLKVTEPLVKYATVDDKKYLFLGLTINGHGREPVKKLDPSYIKYQMNRPGGWCDQHELADENDQPLRVSLRRWRVTYLTNRYKSYGQLSKVTRDAAHTLGTTTVDYIANDSTKHIHEQAIRDALNEVRHLARPQIVPDDNPEKIAVVLDMDITTAGKITRGEQDVLFASCLDFYNRPGGQPNTPCDKPWGCFTCSNAIITRHVLPRVIALRDLIIRARTELSTDDWNGKFSLLWHVVTHDVLPRFSSDAIEEAERLAQEQAFYIPLDIRT
ncbi:MAG: hypothetical protein ACRCTP_09780 [Aeromonas popoffii]|uniref:hypothetical protein n=1 Tax=Aeromonas popoffii TaxID=70856 RepID=UPI003F2F586E